MWGKAKDLGILLAKFKLMDLLMRLIMNLNTAGL